MVEIDWRMAQGIVIGAGAMVLLYLLCNGGGC